MPKARSCKQEYRGSKGEDAKPFHRDAIGFGLLIFVDRVSVPAVSNKRKTLSFDEESFILGRKRNEMECRSIIRTRWRDRRTGGENWIG